MNPADEQRFWSKVDKSGECWIWTSTISNGQGVICIDGKSRYAVRVAWAMENGPAPKHINLRRTCNEPFCIRPSHRCLFQAQPKPSRTPRAQTLYHLVREYPGTYYILNLVNHRIYIGQTRNLQQRIKGHCMALAGDYHHNNALQEDWNEYGAAAFEFGVLVESTASPISESHAGRSSYEDIFVRIYQADDPRYGYNIYHFDSVVKRTDTEREKIHTLAQHWNITANNYTDKVFRRCLDYTFEQLIA